MSYQILIVDDSALIRRSIRSVIEGQSDWRVCGEAENGEIAVQKVSELNPTLVILDFQMPVMNGIEAARQISRIFPTLPMLMFTMHRSEQLEPLAKAVGIRRVVSKSSGMLDDLVSSITSLLQEVPATQETNAESAGEIASHARTTSSLYAQTCSASPSLACIIKCEEKNRLAALYEQATTKCSRTIAELRETMGTCTKEEYQRVEHRTNEARLKSEQARLSLEQHIATHRC